MVKTRNGKKPEAEAKDTTPDNNIVLLKKESGKVENLIYRNEKPRLLTFKCKKAINNEELKKFVKRALDAMYEKGGRASIMVSAEYAIGWRSGFLFDMKSNVSLYNPLDWYNDDVETNFDGKTSKFKIFVFPTEKKAEGGKSENNDCLFYCLKRAYGNDANNLPKEINRPKKLKEFLKLQRDDMVNINDIPKIEELLKNCSISVTGDFFHVSTKVSPLNINLKLSNAHYTLIQNDDSKKFRPGVHFRPKTKDEIFSYKKMEGGGYQTYNGNEEKTMTDDEFMQIYQTFKYIFINANGDDIKERYNKHIAIADELLKETNGKVNLYKYDTTAIASVDIWELMTKIKKNPEQITPLESIILDNAFRGGLMYVDKEYKGFVKTYDFNSWYPSLMTHKRFNIPVKEGKAEKLTKEQFDEMKTEKYYKYGIYRVCISKSEDKNVNKLFKFNTNNHYTHYDLLGAHELELHMELLEDDEWNYYGYDKTKLISCHTLFDSFVDYFYDLKQKTKGAKLILNSLWGALCKKQLVEKYIDTTSTTVYTIPNEYDLSRVDVMSENILKLKMEKTGKRFVTDYARMGPFLTAFGRYHMMKYAKKYRNTIVKIHTDSISINQDVILSDLPISEKIGCCKVEKSGVVESLRLNEKTIYV